MSLEPEFLDFMPHTITVYDWDGYNQYAEPSYSTVGITYSAMVEQRPDIVRAIFGDEVMASHTAYVASTSAIPLTSRVVLHDGSEPPLIRATAFSDETGEVHHVLLAFGSGAA
jgi:hypothetical protein